MFYDLKFEISLKYRGFLAPAFLVLAGITDVAAKRVWSDQLSQGEEEAEEDERGSQRHPFFCFQHSGN